MDKPGMLGLSKLPDELLYWNKLFSIASQLGGFIIPEEVLTAQKRADRLIARFETRGDRPQLLDQAAKLYAARVTRVLEGTLAIFFINFRRNSAARLERLILLLDQPEGTTHRMIREALWDMTQVITSKEEAYLELAMELMMQVQNGFDLLIDGEISCYMYSGVGEGFRSSSATAGA